MKLSIFFKSRLRSLALVMLASVLSIAGLGAMEESAEPFGFPGAAGASVGPVAARARRTANPYLPGVESVRHAKTAEPTGIGASSQLSVPAEQSTQIVPVIQGPKTVETERFATIMKNITSKNMPHDVVRDRIISQLNNDDKVKLVSAALERVPKEYRNALLKISSQDYNAMISALSNYASSIAEDAVRERVLDYMKIKMAVTDYFVKHTVRSGRRVELLSYFFYDQKRAWSQTLSIPEQDARFLDRVSTLEFDPNNPNILYGITYWRIDDELQPSYIFMLDVTQTGPVTRAIYANSAQSGFNSIADLKVLSRDRLAFIYPYQAWRPLFLEKKEHVWRVTEPVTVADAAQAKLEKSSDGSLLAFNLSSELSLMDRQGKLLEVKGGPLSWYQSDARAAFSCDNKYLALTSFMQPITILNIATGERRSIPFEEKSDPVLGIDFVKALSYSPVTGDLIVAYYLGHIDVYDPLTLEIKSSFKTLARLHTMVLSPDGKTIATNSGRKVQLFNATTGELLHTLSAPARTRSLAFSHDNSRLAAGVDGGAVMIWDAPEFGW